VAKGDMNPQLEKAVSALQPGGVSDPIATGSGYRIVRLVSKEDASVTPFEDVREDLLKRLQQDRMAKAYEEYVEGLRKASEKTTKTMVNEVSLQVPVVETPILSGAGLAGAPVPEGAPQASPTPAPLVPAIPGVDASEISTTGQARPERIAPEPPPGQATPAPSPATAPSPSPSPGSDK
jgi:hypothetical protein